MRRTVAAAGPLDPAAVWERYADLDRWPEWSPAIRSVDATARRIAPGVRGLVHGPPGVGVAFEVTGVDADARWWAWRVAFGPVHAVLEHEVLAAREGCVTTLTIDAPAAVALAYPEVARLALARLVRP